MWNKKFVILGCAILFGLVLSVFVTSYSTSSAQNYYYEYTVQAGDTIYSIAQKFGISYQSIASQNSIGSPYTVYAGEILEIPLHSASLTYTVQSGDTVYLISQKFEVSWQSIASTNAIPSPYIIDIGEKLVIPLVVSATSSTSSRMSSISSSSTSSSSSSYLTLTLSTTFFISSTSTLVTTTTTTTTSTLVSATTTTATSTALVTTTMTVTETSTSTATTTITSTLSSVPQDPAKQTLIYLAGVNYDQAVEDYSTRKGITALGPQVYALDQNGNVFLEDTSFNASEFTSLAHAAGLQVIPLVMAGSGLCSGSEVWCSDNGILAIINNSTQLSRFENELVSLCQANGFDGIQLDWETGLSPSYQQAMTTALDGIANALHSMSPRRSLSFTTYYWDLHAGPYNLQALSEGPIDQINLQDYTNNMSDFESWASSIISGGIENMSKLSIGMGDYSGVNPPIAGQCMQYLLQNGVSSVALWPNAGTEVSLGGYGYSDTVYGTSNFYQLLALFLSSPSG